MTVSTSALIETKYAENTQTTQYTSSNVKTVIDKFTVANDSGGSVTFAANLVPSGGSAGASNLKLSRTILDGETYRCPELVGHTLESGDFISTIAGSASSLVIRASGRIVSS
jgi:hypothetical protein